MLPSANDHLERMRHHVSVCTRRLFEVDPKGVAVERDYRFIGVYGNLDIPGVEADEETLRIWQETKEGRSPWQTA